MDSFSQTTTVLTLDVPTEIDERLRRALRSQGRTARDVTLEALELWLDRYEASFEAAEVRAEPAERS